MVILLEGRHLQFFCLQKTRPFKLGLGDSSDWMTDLTCTDVQSRSRFNPSTAKLFHWDFPPPKVIENYSALPNKGQRLCEILLFDVTFPQKLVFNVLMKMKKRI